jgi:hypothetical protein
VRAGGERNIDPVVGRVGTIDDRAIEVRAIDDKDAGLPAVLRRLESVRAGALDLAVCIGGDNLHRREFHCRVSWNRAESYEPQREHGNPKVRHLSSGVVAVHLSNARATREPAHTPENFLENFGVVLLLRRQLRKAALQLRDLRQVVLNDVRVRRIALQEMLVVILRGVEGLERRARRSRSKRGALHWFEPALSLGRQEFRRIASDPAIMGGKPSIRGMRVTVGMIVEAISAGRRNCCPTFRTWKSRTSVKRWPTQRAYLRTRSSCGQFARILAYPADDKPSAILLRGEPLIPELRASALLSGIADCATDLDAGAILTIDWSDKSRARLLPLK